jgi:parallel beta-helix repeat protein
MISGSGAASEISVQPGNSIQSAVNNSISGDVITLSPGTYTENIKITKDNLTIRSESGNPDDTIIQAGNPDANVLLLKANNITISGLKILGATDPAYSGIYLSSCRNCTIDNNKFLNNGLGIYTLYSRGNIVSNNTVTNNEEYGIAIQSSKDNTISGNTASDNTRGIHFGNSDGNTFSGNIVQNNSVYGFYICPRSDRNLIYNNYFNNTNMTIKNGEENSYNTTKTAGTNILGGPYIAGNFWGRPDGTGFSQTAADKDGDGIADSSYQITGSNYSDYLPLVNSSASSLQQ